MRHTHRRLIKIGGSTGITFPKDFLDQTSLEPGGDAGVVSNDILVIVKPRLSGKGSPADEELELPKQRNLI